jgi:hypothetical protein
MQHTLLETVATPTDLMKAMQAAKHPYYQSSDTTDSFKDINAFLESWKDYDIDLNRVIRWDIRNVSDDFPEPADMEPSDIDYYGPWGTQYMDIHYVAPRKGYTFSNRILNLKPGDMPRLCAWLNKHWEYTRLMWDPIPTTIYVPPESPRSRFLDKIKAVTDQHIVSPVIPGDSLRQERNERVQAVVRDVLEVIDTGYLLFEQSSDMDVPLDPILNIAGELAKTYFDEINS